MSPAGHGDVGRDVGPPRASGDEPWPQLVVDTYEKSAPRERG